MRNYQKGSIYPFLRKLGNGPNDLKNKPFILPSHSDMSPLECAEDIASYFASISQEIPPINPVLFPPSLTHFLESPQVEEIPNITEYNVFYEN